MTYEIVRINDSELLKVTMPWGYVLFGWPGLNEMCIVTTMGGDPPGLRFISADGNSGKWSFCIGPTAIERLNEAVELLLFQGKKDERTRGMTVHYGEGSLHVRGPKRWTGMNAEGKQDDQMYHIARLLHDQVWFRNLVTTDQTAPYPDLIIPIDDVPPTPLPNADLQTWLADTPKHRDELDAIAREFAAVGGPEFVPDDKTREKYLNGTNRDLGSIHADMVKRNNGIDPGPCQWKDA